MFAGLGLQGCATTVDISAIEGLSSVVPFSEKNFADGTYRFSEGGFPIFNSSVEQAIIERRYDDAMNALVKSNRATDEAYYGMGVVAEAKSSSILDNLVTDSAQRDVKSTLEAYSYFMDLIDTFPNSKYSEDASKKLSSLMNTLARHELYVAIYYTKIDSNIAAVNRAKYIIENYPNSSSIPDALHLMAYNYDVINAFQLATDSRQILSFSYPNYSPNYSIK